MEVTPDIIDQCDTKIDYINIYRSVTYILWCSDFASYLEDCWMEEYYIWDNGGV